MSKKVSADSDLHCTLSPPPSASHVGERHGTHYASAGDITSLSRPDTTSQSDSSEALGNPNQETLYHTALEMDQSSQDIPSGVDPDALAHLDPTIRVHEESTGQEDTGKVEDMDDKELYPLFSDNEFRDSKMNVASINDSQDFDKSPRQISFGSDYSVPDRLENDSIEFRSFDDVMLTSTPVREKRKMKKTDNMSAALVFKTSSPITQLTNDSDDAGLKHEDRIIDAGIHMTEKVESSGIDDFPLSDGKELEYNASELQSQDVNAKDSTSTSPSVTTPVSSSKSRERDNVQADIDTENLVYTYSQDEKLLPTVSQRSSSELPTPMKPFKGESLQHQTLYVVETAGESLEHQTLYAVETAGESLEHQTLYAVETAGGDKDNESYAVHKQNLSVDDIPPSSVHGVNYTDASHTIPDDSSATNALKARSFVLHCKDLASIAEAKMINSSKKALSVRFSDEIIEIPPPDEFEMEQHDAHDSAFPIIGSNLDSLNIETGPAVDSLDSMIDGTSIMKVNANILIGLRVTGSVEMMKMHQKKMNKHGKNDTPGSEMSLQGDQNYQNLEERGIKDIGEGSYSISHGGKTFQEDFQIEQSSIITPHQSTDFAQTYLVQETELQSKEEDLAEKSIDTQHSYVLIESASTDVIELKLPVEEAEGKTMSLDHQIESQGASHKLDHLIQDGAGEQSIKIEETGEKSQQISIEDLVSSTEIEHTIEKLNRHKNHEGFGEQPVEHEHLLEKSVLKHSIESTGQFVQQVVQASESESETSLHEGENYQSLEERGLKDIKEISHSLNHRGKIFQQDFQIEQFSHITSHESVPSKTEEKSIETPPSYVVIQGLSNINELKPPVEEADGKPKNLNNQIESQGASHKLDHLFQSDTSEQSIKIEETVKIYLQSHKSSTEGLASNVEIEHTSQRSSRYENHEGFGEQPVEHGQVLEKSEVKPFIESTGLSVQQAVPASEAGFEASFQEDINYQRVEERGFKYIIEDSHSCLLPVLDSHSVSHKGKIFLQDFQNEQSSVITPHQSTYSAEFYFVKDMEQQSKEEKEEQIIGVSMETQPSYAVIQGAINDVIELKPPVAEAEAKSLSIDHQIESQGASHKLDHLIQDGTGEQSIKTEETGEKCLQSHKNSTEDIVSSTEIEHTIERLDRHENHEGFGEQFVVHDQVLVKSIGKSCTASIRQSVQQAAQTGECFRNYPPSLLEPYISIQEAAKKEPVIYPINAASDSASLKKVVLIDQLQQVGRTPLKNVEDGNVLSTFTSEINLTFANSEDSLSIGRSSLSSVVQPEHGQLNGSMVDDRTRYAETEVYQDSNQGKDDEEHSVPQKVTSKKDVSKINIRQIEEDLEPTLDISHFPGLKIKPRTRKIHLGPGGAGFLGPQDSLQKVIPPSQFLKMKQKRIVGKIQSTASSDSKAVVFADQKQNGIGTIKDSQTTYSYKEKGKVDSLNVRQSTETTSYSDFEENDRKVKTNKENTNATKEVPNSFSIEQKDSWQQLQAKPGSVLDEIENVPAGGTTGKKSVPELKTASSQTEGNNHKINDQKRDIADDMSGRNGNASNESHENINFDHRTPSKLPEIYHNKNIEEELLEACKGQDNTANHQVKDSDSLEMKGNEDKLLGYVEVQNTSPSDLLPRVKERKEVEDKSASDGELKHTTLTSLLDRATHCEEMTDQSPGYGEFQYTTLSSLLHSVKEKKEVENKSPVCCELQYITPTRLFDRHIQSRKMSDQSPRYGEFQYTTPSDLFYRVMERNEGENRLPGYGELLYTTSSRLLERQIQSEEMSNQSPVYGEFQYTTPSGLLHRVKEGTEVENRSPVYGELKYTTPAVFLDTHMPSRKMSDQSQRYGEFQYTTPSGVLHEVMKRNEGENKSPGYGEFPYTTPSRLLERHVQSEEMSDHSPGYGEFQYTTPSVLLHRAKERNESENKSPGYGELPYTTPSRLLERRVQSEEMSGHSPGYGELQYTTPSGLLHRAKERSEGESRSPGYGELPYTTPSRLLERHVQSEEMSDHSPGYGEFQYTTPSVLLHRAKERNESENKSPGYGELPYTTPSRLLERHIQSEEMSGHSPGYRDRSRDSGENKYTSSSIYGELQYTTPSVFLESHMPSRKMSDQSPGYGEFQYATPSGLLYGVMNRNEGENKSPGYGEFPYTTPSRLLERHVQSEEMSDHSAGYGEFQYTTPSVLLHRAKERNESENKSPGYGELPYTTPSRLLERHIQSEEMSGYSPGYRDRSRDSGENKYTSSSIYGELQYTTPSVFLESHMPSRKMSDQSPGYGEFQYTTPSGLFYGVMNRNEGENKSPGYGEFPYTTPSRLLERHVQSEEMSGHSPGYGEFQYTTPSVLLYRAKERNEGENRSPGYGEFPYTTPSRLLERHIQSEKMSDHSPVYGEFQYTTPSGLLHRAKERKICEDKLPGYGEPLYTTPSRFLYKQIQRREVTDQSPGYEEFQYRTPQGLFSRDRKLNDGEDRSPTFGELLYTAPNKLLDRSIQSDKMSDQSPGYGEFQYITPSGLLCRVSERKESENRSPDSGKNKHTAFSKLSDMDMKGREIPDHSPCFEESLNTTLSGLMHRDDARQAFEEISPRYGKLCYITPSVLIYKDNKRQDSKEKLLLSGKFQHKMPSQLLAIERRREERDDKSPGHNTFRYSTPSLLLYQELLRRQNVDASSLGHRVPMQDTLIKVESRTDDEGYGYQEYTTPSQILEKSNKVTYASESSPCLEYHFARIPSQMLVRNVDRKKPENVTQGYEFPGNVSPSELFNRRQALEKGKSKPSEGHVHQYLRYPSGPLQMNMHRPYEIEYPLSDGEYRYSAPSRLLEAMNQRGPAEHMTGEASSSRHPLARDHDKYDEHKVSVEYTNPPIFIQKGEDRDQTRRSKTAEYGAFIDSTPLRQIDLENTTRLGQEPSSQSAVLRVCDLKGQKEGIMYQHEYTNSAAADRNTSTASFCMSENKVPATVQYPSTASFNKLYSKVPTAVGEFQYKTPSGVLHRVKERHEGVDRSLGYGELLYATPYRFLDRSIQTEKICDQSPGYGQFQYRTPSGLLCRVSDRKEGKDRSPGSGEIKYTTSSRVSDMDMKGREITDHLPCFEEVPYTTPSGIIHRDDARQAFEEISPRYGKFCYVTPSVLIHKDSMGQDSEEKSHQSGKFQFKMPSQLLAAERKRGESDDKSPLHHALRYSTPSLLLYKEFLRRQNVDASSPGHRVPMQDTLNKVKSRSEDEGYGNQEYTTPSQILEKSNKVAYASQSSPCLEYHYSTIPSQMLVRNFDREKPENVTQGYEFPGNVSPSELFNRRQALEKGKSKPSEGHVHQNLIRPSGPLQMQMYGPYEIEHLSSDGEYQNITPSRVEVMNQRGPAEPMTGETSSLRHLLARDHDKYDEHKVSVEYTNPPIFIQKGEDRDQTRRSKTAEYGAFIDSTPLRLINLENTTRHGQEPSSLSAVLINGDLERQEEEAILYQHEYDNYVVADRNENAKDKEETESSVDPDCRMKPATIRHASTASLQKSESEVPATVQYTSTAGFHKSESEVPATVQYTSTAGFQKSEREVPATVQYNSTAGFHKSEREVPATVQYTTTAGFHKSEREVPATVQYTSNAGFHKSEREVPATVQYTSTAGFQKSESEVPATVQYTSTAGFHKSESEVPATVQYTSTAGFQKSEREVPATVQYNSTAGFHKSEREVPATVQCTTTAGFHKSEREVPATVPYTSTAGFHKSEREVPATVPYTSTAGFHKSEREVPATVQYTSNAGFHKSESEVPATVQYTSTAGFHKSEREVPATVQYTSNAGFHKSEREVPATVPYTSTAGFHKSESEVPATVQYTSTAGFHKSEREVPATVQYTSTAGFHKSESEVPATIQYASTASFNKLDSEVPTTIQHSSTSSFNKRECKAAVIIEQASSESFSKSENEVEHAEIIHRLMVVLGNTAVFLAAYTEQEIISLLTIMKTGQEKRSNKCWGKGNGPAESSVQRERCGSIAPFWGNQEVQEPHHVAWMTSVCTLKVLKASLTSKSEADLYQILVDIHSLLACANSFMKEHGNITLDPLIQSNSDYHTSIDRMDVVKGARRMSEPYRWFFSEEFVQTTTLHEFLNMIQNTPQMESSHIVLRSKPFRNVMDGDVSSAEITVPFRDSVHIQSLFSNPVHQSRIHTSDTQLKQLPQKMYSTGSSDVSAWDISNISYTPPHTRRSVIWQNKDGSLSQSVGDFQDFLSRKLPKAHQSKRLSSFSLVINPSFNLSSDEEDLETARKQDSAKGQIVSTPGNKKYDKTNKKLFKQGVGKDKSPDRGQRLYGSSLGLNWQSDGKRERGGGRPGTSPDARSFMMEREVIMSQNRKLQGEINTLHTENKLLKEKYNRTRAKIAELENELQEAQSELATLLETSNQEITELTNRSRSANQKDRQQLQSKILALTKENESFKLESASLEKQIENSRNLLDTIHQTGEKSKLLEAQKTELNAVNKQLGCLRALLEQSEQHFHKEEEQHSETRKRVQKLTELNNLLQQQAGATHDEAVIDKQIQSLEKRLKVTEERLYQERADRANNLSQIEEKLLAENAQFQVIEKDLSRQLQREKEKNRNLEKNIKDLREEIEKLHLALPFDESLLTLKKGNYSIPNSGHSSQRAESLRQSNDMNYILAQIEKEDGLGAGQEQDIIRELWNKRKLAYMQLHELEIQLIELGISDNIAEGLKNLRDTCGQAETKMKQMEERLSDMQFEMASLENTYKQQLTVLVHERHDAFAHLKTAEDLLEALKTENQSLKLSLRGSQSATAHQGGSAADKNAETELIRSQVQSLESQLTQVVRSNQLLEGELKTLDVQLNSRNLALQESKEELELLYANIKDDETSNRKQQTIDRLSAQVIDLNAEIGMWNDRNNTLLTENEKLEDTVAAVRKKEISMLKTKQQQRADLVQIEDLQEELDEKERKIEHQKDQLYGLDGQLQKVRQDLYMEQEHTAELETEVESLQQTVTQRAQMFEVLIGSEREQLAQFQLLKDTLDSVSKELDQKKAQVKSLEIDLSLSKNRVEGLERDLQELRQERSYDTKFHPPPQSSMGDRLRIRELEGERTTLKQELAQLHSTVQLAEERASQAQKELCQLESELVKGKTTILQLTAEKHELEQHLEIAEENDSLIQERGQAEEDLVRLEKKLQEILEKFEQEARKQHSNFETRYVNISVDSRKLLNELDSLRLLLEGKEREAEMIQDRSMRQQMEVSFLQRKVELIQNQMISNREDIARMVSELAIKMKEAVGTREVNLFLVNERAKLQTENYHLEKDLEKERETKVQIKKEMEEITKKIEKLQEHSKSTEKEAQNKANHIATIETDLHNATRNIAHRELEVSQQKNKIEHLNNDIKNLTNINTTLEKRFEMEKNTLAEEKETSRRLKDDVTNMTHKLEMLQHEHQLTQDKLATEQQTVEKLRNQSESYHEECERLKKEISGHKNDLDILRGQVLLGKDAVEKLKQEKEYLSHEYEVLCRHLNDKENELKLHREESLHKLDSLQRELYQEKTTQENNKTLVQKELDLSRSELEKLAEKLHQKEIQLQSFGRTLQELEAINREKREMEANVQRLETLVRDNKVILDGQRKEIMIHIEANSKQQELLAKAEATKQTLYGELQVHQENSQHEIRDLQITIKELQSQHEAERSALAETLTQSQSQLQASQSHLALAADARDKLQGRVRILERDLEEIKAKLSDESTGRHLTEHSVGSLRLQLEDTKNQKIVAEARLSEIEKALAKAESQLKMEKEKLKKLSGRIQEAQVNSHSTESSVKAKQEQVDLLQKENNKLRQMLDSQKQSLTSKMKMSMLDLKQQLEMVQNERDKMSSQMQKLSTDLDQSREQIAAKNKENYKLQEEILALEDQVRECKIKLKTAEDSLKTETAVQDQLTHRYAEQEEELKVLKNFLAKKAEESGDADKAMWHDMNRVIQDLSHQMQSHLESQKQNKEARESPQQIQKHKRQIMDLQGELATERSLHQIARDSLQALEEDCKRLRHQLHVLRRRESSASDKKYKNRMEAINAIIAKSQSQAQALLASGGYHDDISSPRPDYSIYSPRMGYRSPSPHMGYSSPQRAFSPDNSMASEFSIASTGPMVPTFESSASHKSHVRRN